MNFKKLQRQYKFNDKDAPKHKHDYCVEAIAEIHTDIQGVFRHHVIKCNICDSFKCIELPNNMTGIVEFEEEINPDLPVVKLKTKHKFDYFQDLEKEVD